MTLALSIRNELCFANGIITQPIGALLSAWTCNNHIVITWILNLVLKGISFSILFFDSAHAV